MICLVIGGAKSGKSMYAQNLSKILGNSNGDMYYVATMNPYDGEDLNRIENHIKEREGYGFKTIEIQRNICSLASETKENDTLLIDSLTSIVTNEMFIGKKIIESVQGNIIIELKVLCEFVSNVVMVSDYSSSDSINYDSYTNNFKKELGLVNIELSKYCDVVIECAFNNIIIHKGKTILEHYKIANNITNLQY